MSTTDKRVLREVLGRMADEAPEPVGFEELGVIELQEGGSAPRAKWIQRPVNVMTVAVLATIVLAGVGALVFANDPASPPVPDTGTVLMVPTNTAEGMTLSHASMWNGNGDGTNDPVDAVTTSLVYLPPGQETWGGDGERFVTIDVDDRFAMLERERLICYQDDELDVPIDSETCRRQLEESKCSGLAAMREGRLDAAACIREARENLQRLQEDPPQGMEHLSDTDVTFTELAIRGKPALLAEIEGLSVEVTTFEGGGVVSTVTGLLLDREVVLEVAEGLQPVTPDRYSTFAATATN
jgi:hypothetical protein